MLQSAIFEIMSETYGVLKVRYRFCPFCETDNSAVKPSGYSLDVWYIVTCQKCSFVYIDKTPAYEELKENLSWEKNYEIEAQRRARMRPVSYKLSRLTRWRMHILPRKKFPDLVKRFADPGHVLDVGCGDGSQMLDLDSAYHPNGIEISAHLAKAADNLFGQYGGGCVNAPALQGLERLPENKFSAVTLRSYLEHESQPLPVLSEVYRVLKINGVAIIKVPHYGSWNRVVMGRKWCGFRYPDHQNYFTPMSLKEMARRAGFSKFKKHWSFTLPTSDNMYLVLQK